MNVWILNYEHRHGSNVSVYTTHELALKGRAEIARANWSDRPWPDAHLEDEPAIMTDQEVSDAYFDDNEHEWTSIEEHNVMGT